MTEPTPEQRMIQHVINMLGQAHWRIAELMTELDMLRAKTAEKPDETGRDAVQ